MVHESDVPPAEIGYNCDLCKHLYNLIFICATRRWKYKFPNTWYKGCASENDTFKCHV